MIPQRGLGQGRGTVYCVDQYIAICYSLKRVLQYCNMSEANIAILHYIVFRGYNILDDSIEIEGFSNVH